MVRPTINFLLLIRGLIFYNKREKMTRKGRHKLESITKKVRRRRNALPKQNHEDYYCPVLYTGTIACYIHTTTHKDPHFYFN